MDQTERFLSEIRAETEYEVCNARHAGGGSGGEQRRVAGGDAVAHLPGAVRRTRGGWCRSTHVVVYGAAGWFARARKQLCSLEGVDKRNGPRGGGVADVAVRCRGLHSVDGGGSVITSRS